MPYLAPLMPYFSLLILVSLMLFLGLLTWLSPQSTDKLREALFRNVGTSYRNQIGFVFGAVASLLLLTSGTWSVSLAAWFFIYALGVLMFLLIVVRPNVEKEVDRFAWGLLVIIMLGFGCGATMYQARSWWIWLWNKYRLIDQPQEIVLEFLFLLGVILGVFVVRNWAKEQKAFTDSVSGLLGGSFIAGIFGEAFKGQGLTTMDALTYYGLGFVMSAAVNLLIAARLTANYTNKRSISSRALLDFLYGNDRTKLIDGYFLQNFKEDPDFAKRLLTSTLVEWRKAAQSAFAERLEKRRSHRQRVVRDHGVDPTIIEKNRRRLRELDPACSKLNEALEDIQELQDELETLKALPEPRPRQKAARLRYIEERMGELDEDVKRLRERCGAEQFEEWGKLKDERGNIRPSYFYELISVECDEKEVRKEQTEVADKEDIVFTIVYKQIGSGGTPIIHPEMFRVGVAARWQDTLEYISAPGEYRQPFPYPGSVSGLALEFRKTIVMDRDLYKRFRNKKHADGICPKDIEQNRGLDEIDYLSYIAIPIVSRPGTPDENPLGVVTIDNKLFVSRSELAGQPLKAAEGIFRLRIKRSKLTGYANNLYDHEDIDVRFIENLSEIITPVLELYAKCRVGAT